MPRSYEELISDVKKRGLETKPSDLKGWLEVPQFGNDTGGWIAESNLIVRPNGHASIKIPDQAEAPKLADSEKVVSPKMAEPMKMQMPPEDYNKFKDSTFGDWKEQFLKTGLKDHVFDAPSAPQEDEHDPYIFNLRNSLLKLGANHNEIKSVVKTMQENDQIPFEKRQAWLDKYMWDNYRATPNEE